MSASDNQNSPTGLLPYLIVGVFFGIVLTKAEVISWFRIQEMFRFQSFHMYGIIGSAILVAALTLRAIRYFRVKSFTQDSIALAPKQVGRGYRYWIGGLLFGLGWGLTGACPGPIFALIGNGVGTASIILLAALAGTWTYSALRPRLPH